jgi:hypothetical protein
MLVNTRQIMVLLDAHHAPQASTTISRQAPAVQPVQEATNVKTRHLFLRCVPLVATVHREALSAATVPVDLTLPHPDSLLALPARQDLFVRLVQLILCLVWWEDSPKRLQQIARGVLLDFTAPRFKTPIWWLVRSGPTRLAELLFVVSRQQVITLQPQMRLHESAQLDHGVRLKPHLAPLLQPAAMSARPVAVLRSHALRATGVALGRRVARLAVLGTIVMRVRHLLLQPAPNVTWDTTVRLRRLGSVVLLESMV